MLSLTFAAQLPDEPDVLIAVNVVDISQEMQRALIKSGFYRHTDSVEQVLTMDGIKYNDNVSTLTSNRRTVLIRIVQSIDTTDFIDTKREIIGALNNPYYTCILL